MVRAMGAVACNETEGAAFTPFMSNLPQEGRQQLPPLCGRATAEVQASSQTSVVDFGRQHPEKPVMAVVEARTESAVRRN